jgi:hypothetical protein
MCDAWLSRYREFTNFSLSENAEEGLMCRDEQETP